MDKLRFELRAFVWWHWRTHYIWHRFRIRLFSIPPRNILLPFLLFIRRLHTYINIHNDICRYIIFIPFQTIYCDSLRCSLANKSLNDTTESILSHLFHRILKSNAEEDESLSSRSPIVWEIKQKYWIEIIEYAWFSWAQFGRKLRTKCLFLRNIFSLSFKDTMCRHSLDVNDELRRTTFTKSISFFFEGHPHGKWSWFGVSCTLSHQHPGSPPRHHRRHFNSREASHLSQCSCVPTICMQIFRNTGYVNRWWSYYV